jgi:hypothetical protein
MSKTTNKFSPEVRERAVRLVLDNQGRHGSRWQAVPGAAFCLFRSLGPPFAFFGSDMSFPPRVGRRSRPVNP